MRTFGRIMNPDGTRTWIEVDSGATDEAVWLTTLEQVLRLGLGESPFYANWGIPAIPCVETQVYPSFYVTRTQMLMAQYFPMLSITQVTGAPSPTYNVTVTLSNGTIAGAQVAV